MKRLILALFIAVTGLAFTATAQAFTRNTTGSMNVSTTILAACTVSTTNLNFGSHTGTVAKFVNSTITVNCTNGTAYRIDIDAGLNTLTSGGARRVKTGTATATSSNTIWYSLYKTTTYTVSNEWGDNGTTYCSTCPTVPTGKSATGTGADQVHTVYGVLSSTTNPAGAYSDTVVVTVNY